MGTNKPGAPNPLSILDKIYTDKLFLNPRYLVSPITIFEIAQIIKEMNIISFRLIILQIHPIMGQKVIYVIEFIPIM